MRYEFKLPDLAEGMVEGELVGWLVAVGDKVKAEQPVAEVMTDKATVVIPSPVAGTILELPWQAGDIVKIGQALMIFDSEGAAPTQRTHAGHVDPNATPGPTPAPGSAPAPAPTPTSTSTPAPTSTPAFYEWWFVVPPAAQRLARSWGCSR